MASEYSVFLQKAIAKIAEVKGVSLDEEARQKHIIELAGYLWEEASRSQTRQDKKRGRLLARMMKDPSGKAFTTYLADRCFRSHRSFCIVDQCLYLMEEFGVPRYLGWIKGIELGFFRLIAFLCPPISAPFLVHAIRKETKHVILFASPKKISKHISKRKKEGSTLNINHLGEAILGEKESNRRLQMYLHDLTSTEITCISVKISTIFSQIHLLARESTLQVLADRLRQLYRAAMKNGPKFVNLDMEEYRDLRLTKDLFLQVLSEPEFLSFSAGIALQAYLPDSFAIQEEITEWAKKRTEAGGAPIKIRLVKGANLAMEQVESSLRLWPQAPYLTKAEVDANYKKMVQYGCKKENAKAVHVGIATHNVFDIAHAMLLQAENELGGGIEFEMLEGMAGSLSRVVQKLVGSILLYCPVATKEEFSSAIAYLIRRLDENTAVENFLHCSFGLKVGSLQWQREVKKFQDAYQGAKNSFSGSRRVQNRFDLPSLIDITSSFVNEPDTDISLETNRKWAQEIQTTWEQKSIHVIPCVIGGEERVLAFQKEGWDPSSPKDPFYHYSLAGWEEIDKALFCAKEEEASWQSVPLEEKMRLLAKVAEALREARKDLIGVMMKDGGKSFIEADPEVSEAIDFAEYYLRSVKELYKHQDIHWKAKGTVLVTPPWNFPVSIPTGGIIGALIMGNCVLLKPAPEAVLSGWVLAKAFWQAGVSKKVLQFIACEDDPVGSKLIADPRINMVVLTGATETARLFMKIRPDIDLSAETGGKNAMIITALSDRDCAIKDLIHSAFSHCGQKCSATSLAILEAEVYDDPHFLQQLKDAVESLCIGSTWDFAVKITPLIRPPGAALQRALTVLEKGESWLVEPKQDPTNPNLWSPGVKLGVCSGSFLHQTECFGPILSIMRAESLDHAIELANSTAYGLTAGIHSLDEREIVKWLGKMEAGNLYINRSTTGAIVQRQPFGGCKASNFGIGVKAGGPNYLTAFAKIEQIALSPHRISPCKDLHHLIELYQEQSFSAEEMGLLYGGACSYTYWSSHFPREYDVQNPSALSDLVIGQDNILYYVPRRKLLFRVQKEDTLSSVLQVLSVALCANISLLVSIGEASFDIHPLLGTFSLLTVIQETEQEFLQGLAQYERIRLLSSPTDSLRKMAAEQGCFLDVGRPYTNGRFELLRYLREVAVSHDYHRYGNLGTREGEKRNQII